MRIGPPIKINPPIPVPVASMIFPTTDSIITPTV